ncbi:MAG: undecaprenyl diphosphate synthase family protein, partial [Defluviitaleaceae bacterium]|nr:undecaprenyl diphosphate synthase family protein [Defluviitaleaceae bacterium]
SNFMMWQLAYSELYFTDKLWPDFSFDDMMQAVSVYNERERRFGG